MKKHIIIGVIGVIRKNNKYLLTYRQGDIDDKWANNHWQFPGGGMEYGETPEITLKRELKEELGINAKIITLIPKLVTKKRENWQGLFISYLCSYSGKQKILLNEEASNYDWFNIKEIKKLTSLPGTLDIVIEAEECGRAL